MILQLNISKTRVVLTGYMLDREHDVMLLRMALCNIRCISKPGLVTPTTRWVEATRFSELTVDMCDLIDHTSKPGLVSPTTRWIETTRFGELGTATCDLVDHTSKPGPVSLTTRWIEVARFSALRTAE